MQRYNLHWRVYINEYSDYDHCTIELWHKTWYNETELCKEIHCTEEETDFLIKSNPVTLMSCEFFFSCLHNTMD